MKALTTFFVLLLLFGCDNAPHKESEVEGNTTNTKAPSESLPVIDFPLLGEARPVDLIDMTLEFPESLKKLNGQRVSMVGFMAPFDSLEDMVRCQMVPSYVGCNFCSPPNLRQVVYITQGKDDEPEQTYPFIEEPSYVTGTFRISLPESVHEGKEQGFIYSIENAVVTAHKGDAPKRAPGHGTPAGHQAGQGTAPLSPVVPADLVREIAEIFGQSPVPSIEVDRVSVEAFAQLVRGELEATYPKESRAARTRAFQLLGVLPEEADWIDALAGFEFAQRVAASDSSGKRIVLLDAVPIDQPYVRLELVGAIADALIRQGLAKLAPGKAYASEESDDARRAKEALLQGARNVVVRRYARALGISLSAPPPNEFVPLGKWMQGTDLLNRWYTLPGEVGPYFVNFKVGSTGPLENLVLGRPPTTTIEFFRPLWHRDSNLWKRDPVPGDFADDLTKTPPDFTDVLGAGGLMPFLASENSGHVVMTVSGQWAGDRWALWQSPDGSAGLLLETRWQDETSALEFSAAIPQYPFQWFFPHEEGSSKVRFLRATSPAALLRMIPSNE